LTLTFSTLSKSGNLNPRPGCAVPITAPLRKRTPRSVWSTVYQLPPPMIRITMRATTTPMMPRFIPVLLVADSGKYCAKPNEG
jgi:hypothetical protein